MTRKNPKVFVAMSGGVDSSVAALLLRRKNYDAVGVFIRSYNLDGCAERDAEDARRVAGKLDVPFYVFDFEEEYKKKVVDYMIAGYRAGLTPNPDVMCNKEIKFGLFLKKALGLGADYVATGHYVRLRSSRHRAGGSSSSQPLDARLRSRRGDSFGDQARRASESLSGENPLALLEAKDKDKDQSYFLWTLTQKQLKYCLFPIGDYLKSEVREIARKAGLPTAEKKDSQGICFLGKVTLDEFLGNYIPEKTGAVLTTAGDKIGEHKGAEFYTIGQRHIGLANRGTTLAERGLTRTKDFKPLYVAEKNIRANTLVLAEGDDNPALYKKEVELTDVNFINPDIPSLIRAPARRSKSEGGNGGIRVFARVRYRQSLVPAKLINLGLITYKLEFDSPVKFVAAGQSAVFYLPSEASAKESGENGEMLGGGVIK